MRASMEFIGVGVAVLVGIAELSSARDLKPRYEVGSETYYLRTLSKTESGKIEDKDMPETHNTTEVGLKIKVLDAKPDGSALLECLVLFVDRAEVIGDSSSAYDSRTRGGKVPPWASRLRDYLNKPIKISVSADGTITEVKGIPGTASGKFNRFEDLFSETAFRQLPLFATAGAREGATGASWSQKLETQAAMSASKLIEERTYRLEKTGEVAEISMTGKTVSQEDPKSEKDTSAQMKVEVKEGTRTGRMLWDTAKGQLVEFRSELKLRIGQTMPGAPANMSMDIEQKVADSLKRCSQEEFKLPAPPPKAKKPDAKVEPSPAPAESESRAAPEDKTEPDAQPDDDQGAGGATPPH